MSHLASSLLNNVYSHPCLLHSSILSNQEIFTVECIQVAFAMANHVNIQSINIIIAIINSNNPPHASAAPSSNLMLYIFL